MFGPTTSHLLRFGLWRGSKYLYSQGIWWILEKYVSSWWFSCLLPNMVVFGVGVYYETTIWGAWFFFPTTLSESKYEGSYCFFSSPRHQSSHSQRMTWVSNHRNETHGSFWFWGVQAYLLMFCVWKTKEILYT